MKTQEDIIARLGHSVVALASLCIVLAAIIILMLNRKYTTDVEIVVNDITSSSPSPAPGSPGNNYTPGPNGIDGQKLFKQNCGVCHSMDDRIIVGPGLRDVMDRVPSEEWMHKWIKDPDGMKKSNDPYAQKIDKESSGNMTSFGYMSDDEVNAIIDFIKSM